MARLNIVGFLVLALPATGFAETDPYALSLEELMNVPVVISSRKSLSQRDTPSIVTVISGEEIRNSGARNLIDVLRHVPGMDFRVSVSNGLSLGMRGHIGADGRIMMLVDGIEVNEHRYGSAVFGQGFPVEQIARIEIIRGSASALYGGSAELGVINIITRSAEELNGFHAGAGVGYTTDSKIRSREQANMMAGSAEGAVKWTAMAHTSKAMRSDDTYYSVAYPVAPAPFSTAPTSFDMATSNAVYLKNLNLGMRAGDFSARYLHDDPVMYDRDSGAYTVRTTENENTFKSDSLLLQYQYQPDAQLMLMPNVLYQEQNPRKVTTSAGVVTQETKIKRIQTKLPLTWDIDANLNLAVGVEYLDEKYDGIVRGGYNPPLAFDHTTVSSQYGELQWYRPWGNMTASFRLDDHSQAGPMRASKLGYTRVSGSWHVKLMGSHASVAPSLEDYANALRTSTTVKPETARTWEIETGYRLSPEQQITVNLFDLTTYDTLLISNEQTVHTRGLEAGYKTIKDWGYGDISYSYYNAKGTDTRDVQAVDWTPGSVQVVDNNMNMAFPTHKLAANLHYKLTDGLSFNPSLIYLGPRWAYVAPLVDPVNFESTLTKLDPTYLLNLVLYWQDAAAKGLDVTLGLYNALNQEAVFIQPYRAGHAPLPDMSREVALKAQYKF